MAESAAVGVWKLVENSRERKAAFKYKRKNSDSIPELFLRCGGTSCAEGHEAVCYYHDTGYRDRD